MWQAGLCDVNTRHQARLAYTGYPQPEIERFRLEQKDDTHNAVENSGLLELPLPEDAGWAVINYLRNGRPQTDEHTLFVRHSPEGGRISQRNKLQSILHKYMRRAELEIPKDEHRGLHSLRSSLARTMLEAGTPLPVISEVLGHRTTKSTSHYLKINIEALKKCLLDPEEVFLYE